MKYTLLLSLSFSFFAMNSMNLGKRKRPDLNSTESQEKRGKNDLLYRPCFKKVCRKVPQTPRTQTDCARQLFND